MVPLSVKGIEGTKILSKKIINRYKKTFNENLVKCGLKKNVFRKN